MKTNRLATWIDNLQASGRYCFLRSEAVQATGLSAEAAKKAFQRLITNKRLVKVKKYFFVVVPIEYRNLGSPPASWFVDQLMGAMQVPYYVGLLSAAALHGASHQQPQEFQIVTTKSVRPLIVARQRLHFISKRRLESTVRLSMKTPTGLIQVSSVEATALDLVEFSRAAGGLSNVATILTELASKMASERLIAAANSVEEHTIVQRLGFLLDSIGERRLSDPLAEWLTRKKVRFVPLVPSVTIRNRQRDERWKLLVNEVLEVEV